MYELFVELVCMGYGVVVDDGLGGVPLVTIDIQDVSRF